MEQLPSIAPVYCANGNHEQKMKECEEEYGKAYQNYKKRLVDAGIHMLENEACTLKLGGQNVQIGGLEIPVSFFAKQMPWKHYDSFQDESPEQLMPGQFDMRPVKTEARIRFCWHIRRCMLRPMRTGEWILSCADTFTAESYAFPGSAESFHRS